MRPLIVLLPLALATTAHGSFDQSHRAWTTVLAAHVAGGTVDYAALHRDRTGLDAYLNQLEAVTHDELQAFTREQRFAFWINAYNAYTVKLVLDHYPVASIKKIGGLFRSPFKLAFIPLLRLRGETISLDTIEHDILRKEFADARLHASIVCASTSCPALAAEAYRAPDLDAQLDRAMSEFLGDARRNRWDPATRTLQLSSIFKWFRDDFASSAGSVLGFVRRHAPPTLLTNIETGDPEIEYLDYDWSLNGT